MFVRHHGWLCLSLAGLFAVGCKPAPSPPTTEPAPSSSAGSSAPISQKPPPARVPFRCTAEGAASEGIGFMHDATALLDIEGDASNEARSVIVGALCPRNAAFQACLEDERTAGRLLSRTTFTFSLHEGTIAGVEGGAADLRACVTRAFVGSAAGAASGLKLTFVPGLADRPFPRVSAREVKAPPGVPVEVVAARLRSKHPALRACYDMALREQKTLAGTMLVEHELDPQGKTTKARITSGTMQRPSLEKCVEQRVVDLVFGDPQPAKGGAKRKLSYTLSFSTR